MSDSDFLFSMRLPGTSRHGAMVAELTSNVLHHLGFTPAAAAELSGELQAALTSAAPGPDVDIQFEARGGAIEMRASQHGRRIIRLSRPLP